MDQFISCDWGTSSFRLRIVNKSTKQVLAKVKTNHGIAAVYDSWKQNTSIDRVSFYLDVLQKQIASLEQKYGHSLEGTAVVISGMASSSIGIWELPYKSIPFKTNGTDLLKYIIPSSDTFKHQVSIISGASSANDVMRGEETMIAGCGIADTSREQMFIFPGTHSKHIVVNNGVVNEFKTYMTGELFDLLCHKSILSASVGGPVNNEPCNAAFVKGVKEGIATNFLNNIFHVRTGQLFGNINKEQNFYYLSGLLIGAELKEIIGHGYAELTLVASGQLSNLYTNALHMLGFEKKLHLKSADETLINGQCIILDLAVEN